MRRLLACVLLAAVGCARPTSSAPLPADLPIFDIATGAALTPSAFTARLQSADAVLLGEYHDNAEHHRLRGALLRAPAGRRAAVVFEHFGRGVVPPAGSADSVEPWLARSGFDTKGWRWPLHQPVVDAAFATGRPVRGSNLPSESLRDVVRRGASAGPADLVPVIEAAPLDSASRAALDADIITGHCGAMPASMIGGMRDAQVVRDAAMAKAMLEAAADGPPWLVAGNGHVRRDLAVPRLLAAARPSWRVLAVGFLERDSTGALPSLDAQRGRYDIVVVASHVAGRPDPCAGFRRPARPTTGTTGS